MAKPAESVENALKVRQLNGDDPAAIAALRDAFQRSGLRECDQKRLDLALAPKRPSAFTLAGLYRELGEIEKSMEFLEKSPDEHATQISS